MIDLDITSGVVVAVIFSEDEVAGANPCKKNHAWCYCKLLIYCSPFVVTKYVLLKVLVSIDVFGSSAITVTKYKPESPKVALDSVNTYDMLYPKVR